MPPSSNHRSRKSPSIYSHHRHRNHSYRVSKSALHAPTPIATLAQRATRLFDRSTRALQPFKKLPWATSASIANLTLSLPAMAAATADRIITVDTCPRNAVSGGPPGELIWNAGQMKDMSLTRFLEAHKACRMFGTRISASTEAGYAALRCVCALFDSHIPDMENVMRESGVAQETLDAIFFQGGEFVEWVRGGNFNLRAETEDARTMLPTIVAILQQTPPFMRHSWWQLSLQDLKAMLEVLERGEVQANLLTAAGIFLASLAIFQMGRQIMRGSVGGGSSDDSNNGDDDGDDDGDHDGDHGNNNDRRGNGYFSNKPTNQSNVTATPAAAPKSTPTVAPQRHRDRLGRFIALPSSMISPTAAKTRAKSKGKPAGAAASRATIMSSRRGRLLLVRVR